MRKIKKASILLVEDCSVICEMLMDYFSSLPYTFKITRNGIEALKLLKKKKYDLIITDFEIEGINGLELSIKIKSLYPSIPIIAMSTVNYEKSFNNIGVKKYLKKPFELTELQEFIEQNLNS